MAIYLDLPNFSIQQNSPHPLHQKQNEKLSVIFLVASKEPIIRSGFEVSDLISYEIGLYLHFGFPHPYPNIISPEKQKTEAWNLNKSPSFCEQFSCL